MLILPHLSFQQPHGQLRDVTAFGVDWDSPHAHGLVCLWPLMYGVNRAFNITGRGMESATWVGTDPRAHGVNSEQVTVAFDGASYILMNHNSLLNFGNGPFAVFLWAERFVTGEAHQLVSKRNDDTGTSGNHWWLQITAADLLRASVGQDASNNVTRSTTATISVSRFRHLGFVYPGGGASLKLYIDGIEQAGSDSNVGSVTNANNGDHLTFGAERNNTTTFNGLNGAIAEVRIYGWAPDNAFIRQLADPLLKWDVYEKRKIFMVGAAAELSDAPEKLRMVTSGLRW